MKKNVTFVFLITITLRPGKVLTITTQLVEVMFTLFYK